ncbi:MAG TPA: hypothetical protein DEA96_17865 [Leptospiraceae bacterium]|nr:hypothetical protein [Spirochaetaceae bacterium]HBS06842.1 hypothetical protein [Leptospiraceae bacterium]
MRLPGSLRRLAPGLLLLAAVHCAEPVVIEVYGLDGVESINGFDLFEKAVERKVDLQRKGFLEEGFFEQRDVILYLDRFGRPSAFEQLVPVLNALNNRWDQEESQEQRASLLILLKDTDASIEAWRRIALDMPEGTEARKVAEQITAIEMLRSYKDKDPMPPILGMAQTKSEKEGKVSPELPFQLEGGLPIMKDSNWPPMKEWYGSIDLPEQNRAWSYYPHWRSRVPNRDEGAERFGELPETLPVRRTMQPSEYSGYGPLGTPEDELNEEVARELEDYHFFQQGHRTIISVAGRPLLVRVQYGQVPVYIMAGSEPFLNWQMAQSKNVSFLTFLLHAVSEKAPGSEPLKVTYVERGLVNAGQRATEERSLLFLFAEEPWGLILMQFILVLIVFIWSRFPHERTPLQPAESGTRNFKEHFEALGSKMVRSRKRIQGLAPLGRWKKKQSLDALFPEINQNTKLDEATILKRIRKLWE